MLLNLKVYQQETWSFLLMTVCSRFTTHFATTGPWMALTGSVTPPDKVLRQSHRPLGRCDIWWVEQCCSCDLSQRLLQRYVREVTPDCIYARQQFQTQFSLLTEGCNDAVGMRKVALQTVYVPVFIHWERRMCERVSALLVNNKCLRGSFVLHCASSMSYFISLKANKNLILISKTDKTRGDNYLP